MTKGSVNRKRADKPITPKPEGFVESDDLAADLKEMFVDSMKLNAGGVYQINEELLTMKLVSYITRRDAKVFNHGVQVGRGEK